MAIAHIMAPDRSRTLLGEAGIETSHRLVAISVLEGDERIEISLNPAEARRLYETLKLRF